MAETRDVREIKADDTGEVFRWVNGVQEGEERLWNLELRLTPLGCTGHVDSDSHPHRSLELEITEKTLAQRGLLGEVPESIEALAAMFRSDDARPAPEPTVPPEVTEFLDFHAGHRDLLQKFTGFWALSKERDGSGDSAREAWGRLKWWCNVDGNLTGAVLDDRHFPYYTALALSRNYQRFSGYCHAVDYAIGVSLDELNSIVNRDDQRRGHGTEKGGC